jgi:sulfate/thiosulfate transport system ATP-binding protein
MIVLDGVSKAFGSVRAVDDVSLEILDGTLTAVLGPSGCGKSTLLRLLAGFERVDAGTIAVDGRDVTAQPLRERNVGFVFQNYALFPHLSVERNVAFALDVRGAARELVRARVRELIELVQLTGCEQRYPHELSGGQRQRVALARALAAEPAILLLDEPFAALDLNVRRELRGWLRELHDRVHVTTLLVTHDAEEAMEVADRLVLMREGRVEQTGTPLELYDDPVSPFALHFLGPANAVDGDDGLAFVRPHELRVDDLAFAGSQPARVTRVVELGSRKRYELTLQSGAAVQAELAGTQASAIGARHGDVVFVAPLHARSFTGLDGEGI